MSTLKVLLKLTILLVIAAAVAGVVMLVRRPKSEPVTFDEWPTVPAKPDFEQTSNEA